MKWFKCKMNDSHWSTFLEGWSLKIWIIYVLLIWIPVVHKSCLVYLTRLTVMVSNTIFWWLMWCLWLRFGGKPMIKMIIMLVTFLAFCRLFQWKQSVTSIWKVSPEKRLKLFLHRNLKYILYEYIITMFNFRGLLDKSQPLKISISIFPPITKRRIHDLAHQVEYKIVYSIQEMIVYSVDSV